MRILAVDDSVTIRMIMENVLNAIGHEAVLAKDGLEALEIMHQPNAPKLIVSDWKMPELDGLTLCQRLRQHPFTIPPYIIILTAMRETRQIVECLDAGANDYLTKPFNADELRARINVGCRTIDLQVKLYEAQMAMQNLAMRDSLTNIHNRRSIMDSLNRELSIARRMKTPLYLGMCDLDKFKAVNDNYGHQSGDEVLQEFANRVLKTIRDYDLFGRYGGEEFIVATTQAEGKEGQISFFERIRGAIGESKIVTAAAEIPITVSIGVAESDQNTTLEELIRRADTALYDAKKNGRNCVVYAPQ